MVSILGGHITPLKLVNATKSYKILFFFVFFWILGLVCHLPVAHGDLFQGCLGLESLRTPATWQVSWLSGFLDSWIGIVGFLDPLGEFSGFLDAWLRIFWIWGWGWLARGRHFTVKPSFAQALPMRWWGLAPRILHKNLEKKTEADIAPVWNDEMKSSEW